MIYSPTIIATFVVTVYTRFVIYCIILLYMICRNSVRRWWKEIHLVFYHLTEKTENNILFSDSMKIERIISVKWKQRSQKYQILVNNVKSEIPPELQCANTWCNTFDNVYCVYISWFMWCICKWSIIIPLLPFEGGKQI